MSVYLVPPGAVLVIEFPFNTMDEINEAVHGWITGGQVVSWRLGSEEASFTLHMNFGRLSEVLVTTTPPDGKQPVEQQPPPIVQARLEGSPDSWDVRWLTEQ